MYIIATYTLSFLICLNPPVTLLNCFNEFNFLLELENLSKAEFNDKKMKTLSNGYTYKIILENILIIPLY